MNERKGRRGRRREGARKEGKKKGREFQSFCSFFQSKEEAMSKFLLTSLSWQKERPAKRLPATYLHASCCPIPCLPASVSGIEELPRQCAQWLLTTESLGEDPLRPEGPGMGPLSRHHSSGHYPTGRCFWQTQRGKHQARLPGPLLGHVSTFSTSGL